MRGGILGLLFGHTKIGFGQEELDGFSRQDMRCASSLTRTCLGPAET